MPVLVTGAEDALGAATVERLLRSGGEVRVFLDGTVAGEHDAAALRSRGCKVAVGELDDEGHLEAALAQVHTVVHCWGGPLQQPDDVVTVGATVASALLGAGVRRLVWVRELAADAGNPILAALDTVGELFDDLPLETVTIATGLRHGAADDLTRRLAAGWLRGTAVDGAARHAPVDVVDVAHAIAAADRQRTTVSELRVRLALLGPEEVSLDEHLARLGAPPLRSAVGDAPRDRATSPVGVPAAVVGWLSTSAVAPPDGAAMTIARGTRAIVGHVGAAPHRRS